MRKDPNVNINYFTRFQIKVGNVIIYIIWPQGFFLEKSFTIIGAIWGIINKAKNKGETCDIYARKYGNEFKTKDIATIYTLYEAELKKLNLVVCKNVFTRCCYPNLIITLKDFDNLIIKACELLRKNRYVLANVEGILVDEVSQFKCSFQICL